MYLENVVVDVVDPQRLGRFWEAALGTQRLTDEPDGFETRLAVEGGPDLDLCFQRVGEPPSGSPRLHLDHRDAAFWAWLTGWDDAGSATAPRTLRHPAGRGPLLELCPERSAKGAKNRLHLDVRLEAGEDPDAAAAGIVERGGCELPAQWGDLPWRSYLDPSGNELCVLPARS
ncbi:VOC family protein [Nocardioides sp. SYSU DS0663]|uniref:VOC family protein n=1 Tax=Nocardioides sp. SYSU DS0663 TaxID=3416445 RepID=UPI003F4B1F15